MPTHSSSNQKRLDQSIGQVISKLISRSYLLRKTAAIAGELSKAGARILIEVNDLTDDQVGVYKERLPMGRFGKKAEQRSDDFYWKSDDVRYSKLENNQDVVAMEKQVKYWVGTDEGFDEFNLIFVDGPVIVAKTQRENSAAEMLKGLSEYISTQDRFNLIMEGMLGITASGYAVGLALPHSRGYRAKSKSIDSRMLADETAKIMTKNAPPSDVEWFGYAERNGIFVFQWMLLPLGESNTDVMERAETGYLMLTGRWFLRYGIALAKAQMKLESI